MSWLLLLKGVAIILFAFLAYFWLGDTPASFAVLFAVYAVADGVLSLAAAARGGGIATRSGIALAGLVSLVAGGAAALPSGATSEMIALIIGLWAAARGALEFISALTLRKVMYNNWSLPLIGMLSMLFGGMLIAYPGFEPRMLVRLVSGYSLVTGLLLLILAYRFLKPPREPGF